MSKVVLKDGEILKTDLVNLTKPVMVWNGALTLTSQSISIPITKINGIDRLYLHFQQMGSDTGGDYTGGLEILTSTISATLRTIQTCWQAIGNISSSRYMSGGAITHQRVGDNVIIKWAAKGWFDFPSMAWNNGSTQDNGLSLVRITGYQSFAIADIYNKTEIASLLAASWQPKILTGAFTVRFNGGSVGAALSFTGGTNTSNGGYQFTVPSGTTANDIMISSCGVGGYNEYLYNLQLNVDVSGTTATVACYGFVSKAFTSGTRPYRWVVIK
jgi:hypothetical protein